MKMKVNKESKKLAFWLLGKKPDKRSLNNLDQLSQHILSHREFSGPQLRRLGVGVTWFHDSFVPRMLKKNIIEKSKQETSPGRGVTQYYRVTDAGLLVVSYFQKGKNPKALNVVKEVLENCAEEDENPLVQFSVRCLVNNYPDETLWSLLTKCLSFASMKKGIDQKDIQKLFLEGLFDAHLFVAIPSKCQHEIFEKNIEMMERAPEKKYVFSFYKAQIESHLLGTLKGEKLKKYLESMWETPNLFHIPCLNEECVKVILSETLSKPRYCDECNALKQPEKAS